MISDSHEVRSQLTEAWRAVVRRLVQEGYSESVVYSTMTIVAFGDAIDQELGGQSPLPQEPSAPWQPPRAA